MTMMKENDVKKLTRLGFRQGRTPNNWTRQFKTGGDAKTVLVVRDTVVGYEYRFGLVNLTQLEGEEQWLDASDMRRAIGSIQSAVQFWKKARHALEGGFARRAFRRVGRRLFK